MTDSLAITQGTLVADRYRLEEHITSGGVGQVWRAFDTTLSRTVAVKILRPELRGDPQFDEVFRAEGRALARVDHRGVVRVYEHNTDQSFGPYLVMENIDGTVLSRIIGPAPLQPKWTMELIAQAADALHAVHEQGIVHRNITPGTLMVRSDGTLVLIGFRNAGAADVSEHDNLSPEEKEGGSQTRLTDIYALGIVAYQCLTGRRLFDSSTDRVQMWSSPTAIPSAIRRVVETAISEAPEGRWATAAEFANAARAAIGSGPVHDFEVFVCYRRSDTGGWAGRIFDHLEAAFGGSKIFLDAESIVGGVDFGRASIRAVEKSRIVLVVIGQGWLDAQVHGTRRLDDPRDLVRREIETALKKRKRIVPVLVDGASMPRKDQLPGRLPPLADLSGVEVSLVRFRNDVRLLIESLRV